MESDEFSKTTILVYLIFVALPIFGCIYLFHKLNNYAHDGIASSCETTINSQISSTLENSEVRIFCRLYTDTSFNHQDFDVSHHPILEEGWFADTKIAKLASATLSLSELAINFSRVSILGGIQGLKMALSISSPDDYLPATVAQIYAKYMTNFSSDYANHRREIKKFDELERKDLRDSDAQYDESTREKIRNIRANTEENQRDKDVRRDVNWRLFRLGHAMKRP